MIDRKAVSAEMGSTVRMGGAKSWRLKMIILCLLLAVTSAQEETGTNRKEDGKIKDTKRNTYERVQS